MKTPEEIALQILPHGIEMTNEPGQAYLKQAIRDKLAAAIRAARAEAWRAGCEAMRDQAARICTNQNVYLALSPFDNLYPEPGEVWPHPGYRFSRVISMLPIPEPPPDAAQEQP